MGGVGVGIMIDVLDPEDIISLGAYRKERSKLQRLEKLLSILL